MIEDYLADKYTLHPGCNPLPFNRNDLMSIFAELGYKTCVEIGVNSGRFARLMCERIPGLKYYGVDPYTRYYDFRITNTATMKMRYREALEKTASYDATIIEDFSALAYSRFENDSLDFIYIDGNHDFNYVFSDILLWLPKIRKGGVISGHDYLEPVGVKAAVDFCVKAFRVEQWFLLNDTSWFWEIK